MRGASRQALTQAREHLESELGSVEVEVIRDASADLLNVARLLGRETRLARALADPGTYSEARLSLVDSLFGERVGRATLAVLRHTVELRWSSARDLVDGVELLGAQAAFEAALREGTLDDVEDEIFRFARIVERSPGLSSALADASVPGQEKAALVRGLLAERASPTTTELLAGVAASLRSRPPVRAFDALAVEAAARRERRIAVATVAVPLEEALRARLAAAVSRAVGHEVRLQVEVDPTVLGGIVVRVDDVVLDATVASRLAQATRELAR